jgi:hypothetical protein
MAQYSTSHVAIFEGTSSGETGRESLEIHPGVMEELNLGTRARHI